MWLLWFVLYLIGAAAAGFVTYGLYIISVLSFMASDKGYITAKEWVIIALFWLLTFTSGAGTIALVVLAIQSLF